MGIKEVAAGIDSPEHFIAKILQDLSKRELIQSSKGPNGGFYVDSIARSSTLADIVRAIDGEKIFKGCGLGLKSCSETKPCPLHNDFKKIRKTMQNALEAVKLGTFNKELEQKILFLKR